MSRRATVRTIGVLASSSLAATGLALLGSLVQARYISPDDLGFVRKYTVVSVYAVFLSLGLFTIMQLDYPSLVGRGNEELAKRRFAITQSWSLLTSVVICAALLVLVLVELLNRRWKEASAWAIQVVTVWTALYGGYLTYALLATQKFNRVSKSQLISALTGTVTLPAFLVAPFPTLVARSIAGPLVSSYYLHRVRPLRLGWLLPINEFLPLAKRGLRLYAGSYLRYSFWLTIEIWLMFRFAGDFGVGLLTFSKLLAETPAQISMAVNQVFIPRLSHRFGQTGRVHPVLSLALRPTILNLLVALLLTIAVWLVIPPVILLLFPNYAPAVPLVRILSLQMFFVSLSLPIYLVTILEGYVLQTIAAAAGILVFVATAFALSAAGLRETAVAWGTLAGQAVFTLISLAWVTVKARADRVAILPTDA